MSLVWAAIVYLTLTDPYAADRPMAVARADEPTDFFTALGLTAPPRTDLWVDLGSELAATFARTQAHLGFNSPTWTLIDDRPPPGPAAQPGVTIDPGRWRYQQETAAGLYKRKTKIELPDSQDVWTPYAGRDWKAQEKVHVPVPVPLPVAEQLFVYGQFDGSGDSLNTQQTALYGKTGVGVKWSLIAGSELQVRYATLFSYADELSVGWLQSRAQPAVEVMARVPLVGPLELEYTGSARPALSRADTDRFNQELRFAYPMRGDSELEFGARYQWEYNQSTTPWVDRAQLFLGVKLRH